LQCSYVNISNRLVGLKTLVKNATDERYYYPDLQVSCKLSSLQEYDESAPQLIVEVLSSSTERYDRADKFYAYRKLSSLKEYVLIAQDTPRVEIYRHSTQWDLELFTDIMTTVYLESIELEIALTAIYEGIVFSSKD